MDKVDHEATLIVKDILKRERTRMQSTNLCGFRPGYRTGIQHNELQVRNLFKQSGAARVSNLGLRYHHPEARLFCFKVGKFVASSQGVEERASGSCPLAQLRAAAVASATSLAMQVSDLSQKGTPAAFRSRVDDVFGNLHAEEGPPPWSLSQQQVFRPGKEEAFSSDEEEEAAAQDQRRQELLPGNLVDFEGRLLCAGPP